MKDNAKDFGLIGLFFALIGAPLAILAMARWQDRQIEALAISDSGKG